MTTSDDSTTIPLKRCRKCGKEYPVTLEYFHRRRSGLRSTCKLCRSTAKPKLPVTLGMKRCTRCGNEFPATAEYFRKNSANKDGLRLDCKACQNEDGRRYREANSEKIRQYQRRWAQENPEKAYEAGRRWRTANAEQARENTRRWSQANAERERNNRRLWQRQNYDKIRASKHRRRACKVNLPATFTAEHERIALDYFNGCCAVCERPLRDLFATHTVAMDHWIPLSKGGGTTPDNMIPLCHGKGGCNNRKGSKHPVGWLQSQYGKRKASIILARIEAYFAHINS